MLIRMSSCRICPQGMLPFIETWWNENVKVTYQRKCKNQLLGDVHRVENVKNQL
jgi:hypothetical protein